MAGTGDTRPIPDPTDRDIDFVYREIAALKELLESKVEGRCGIIDARLDGMDKAVAAALQSAEKAVQQQNKYVGEVIDKSDKSIFEQLGALAKRLEDLKERIPGIEGRARGMSETIGYFVGIGGLILAAAIYVGRH